MARKFCKIALTDEAISRLKNEAYLSGISFSEYAGRILETSKKESDFDQTFLKKIIEDSFKELKDSLKNGSRAGAIDLKTFENSIQFQVAFLVWIKEFLTEFCYEQNSKASVPATGTASKKARIVTENLMERLQNGTQKFS